MLIILFLQSQTIFNSIKNTNHFFFINISSKVLYCYVLILNARKILFIIFMVLWSVENVEYYLDS